MERIKAKARMAGNGNFGFWGTAAQTVRSSPRNGRCNIFDFGKRTQMKRFRGLRQLA
jgi:hypothetical protein